MPYLRIRIDDRRIGGEGDQGLLDLVENVGKVLVTQVTELLHSLDLSGKASHPDARDGSCVVRKHFLDFLCNLCIGVQVLAFVHQHVELFHQVLDQQLLLRGLLGKLAESCRVGFTFLGQCLGFIEHDSTRTRFANHRFNLLAKLASHLGRNIRGCFHHAEQDFQVLARLFRILAEHVTGCFQPVFHFSLKLACLETTITKDIIKQAILVFQPKDVVVGVNKHQFLVFSWGLGDSNSGLLLVVQGDGRCL